MKLFALALLPLLSIVGCAAPSDAPAEARPELYNAQHVVFATQDLADAIRVAPITRTFDAAGLMHLSVPVRAVSDLDLTVDYRFTFLDDNHVPLDVPTAWQTQTLHPGSFETITGNATTPNAKDFRLDIRDAR